MMAAFAELLVSATELVELEGLRLRQQVSGLIQSLVLMLVAGAMLVTAGAWLTWASFTALAAALSPAVSGFIMGGVSLLIAGVLLWLGRQNQRSH